MKISVCIPMYNESKIIADTARTVSEYMEKNFEDYEIIFSNDGSTDGCDKIVEELGLPCVKVIGYKENMGKGYAVRRAVLESTGDVAMFTDADLAYGTDVIKRVYDEFSADGDIDMLIGSRNLSADGYEGYTFLRKIMSKTYLKVLCLAGGFKLSDSQCGCKAFSRSAADRIFKLGEVNRFAFDFECILWAVKFDMKIKEMPVKIINHRESKVNIIKDTLRMLRDLRKMKKRIKKAKIEEKDK